MNDLPQRKRIRLPEYDYSQNNYYFVTICTADKKHLFGMSRITAYGLCAEKHLHRISSFFPCVRVDKYVIMPNHIHAVIAIEQDTAARKNACPTPQLGTVIGSYKAAVSREIHRTAPTQIVWQARYYDHVIRNQQDYEAVWRYIDENPLKWELDEYD